MRASRIRLAWRFILVAILISLAAIIWLSQTSTLVSLGYETENLDKQEVLLDRQATQLQAQIAQYEDLNRIEDEAKTKLNMVPAQKKVYVKVPANQIEESAATSSNSKLAPVNDWWRELLEMLPRPFKGSAPPEPTQPRK
jgi:cell division protein FtsL